jgi:hypothetical protein
MGWFAFWANFSQTHLATLSPSPFRTPQSFAFLGCLEINSQSDNNRSWQP